MSALLCFRPQPRARVRLVAFPWAGAAAAALRPLSDALAQEGTAVELHAVAYAGRGHRAAAPLAATLDDVVKDVVDDIAVLAAQHTPIALYGHSFGAVAAFATARALRRRAVAIAHVVVAARAAPSIDLRGGSTASQHRPLRDLDDDALLVLLTASGAIDAGWFDDAERRALFLPPLRRDLALSELACFDDVIDVPLTVLRGADDASVSVDDAARWQAHTSVAPSASGESSASGGVHVVAGGHLFVREQAPAVASLLRRVLTP